MFIIYKFHRGIMGRNNIVLDEALQEWADDIKDKKQVMSLSELVRMCMREAREAIDKKLGRG